MGGRVVLDTNVLVARAVHQLLGTLGAKGAFDVVWSDALLDELLGALTRSKHLDGRGWSAAGASAVAGYVRAGFPDGGVPATAVAAQMSAARLLVHDEGDAHVVALAIAGSAECIVTSNVVDYSIAELADCDIKVITPDKFLLELFVALPDDVMAAVVDQTATQVKYPATPHDLLSILHRSGCPQFAAALCDALSLPPPDPSRPPSAPSDVASDLQAVDTSPDEAESLPAGTPGELIDRLVAAVNAADGDDWVDNAFWVAFALGGGELLSAIPDSGHVYPEGTIGALHRETHELVSREEYFELMKTRLTALVESGLREDVLIRAIRDDLTIRCQEFAQTEAGNTRREEFGKFLVDAAANPEGIARFTEVLAEDEEGQPANDADIAARLKDMAQSEDLARYVL